MANSVFPYVPTFPLSTRLVPFEQIENGPAHSKSAIFNLFHLIAHKLRTKILWPTKQDILFLAALAKKKEKKKEEKYNLIHSHWMAIVVCTVVIFYFGNLREKRSVPST